MYDTTSNPNGNDPSMLKEHDGSAMKNLITFARAEMKECLEHPPEDSFNLKANVQSAEKPDTQALAAYIFYLWMDTCGVATVSINNHTVLSPLKGYGSFLKAFPEFYLILEKTYVDIIRTWHPELVSTFFVGLENPDPSEIYKITSGQNVCYCTELDYSEEHILLKEPFTTADSKTFQKIETHVDHPLDNILSGYEPVEAKSLKLDINKLDFISKIPSFSLRLHKDSPLLATIKEHIKLEAKILRT